MNPVQFPEYQSAESHSSLLVQDCQRLKAILEEYAQDVPIIDGEK